VKPFILHYLPEAEAYLCPVRALAEWVAASEIKSGYLFRRIQSDRVNVDDVPMVRMSRELQENRTEASY
jgi:hypothetical protein